MRLCLIISDGIKTIAIDQTAITLPFRSSSTTSFVLNGKEICQKGCCAFRVFVFLTERTFLLVFSRFRRGRRGCSSSLTEVFNTTQNNSRYATISFKNLTIWWKMCEQNDIYRYPQGGSNVVLKATGRIYYLQCVFVKQKIARKNDGNRTWHFLWIKKCMFKRAIHKLMTQAEKMGSMRKSPLNRYASVLNVTYRHLENFGLIFIISRHCQHRPSYTIPNLYNTLSSPVFFDLYFNRIILWGFLKLDNFIRCKNRPWGSSKLYTKDRELKKNFP